MKKPKQVTEAKVFDEPPMGAKHFNELPKEVQDGIKKALADGNFEFALDEESKAELKEIGITEQDILNAMLKDAKMIN